VREAIKQEMIADERKERYQTYLPLDRLGCTLLEPCRFK
jgi:hypothetical protein